MNTDDTVILVGKFLPQGRTVPAGNGWAWIVSAWTIFRGAVGPWIGVTLVLAIGLIVLGVLPVIGPIATFVLAPVITGGVVMASRGIEQGGTPGFGQFFGGFSYRFGALATVGAIYLAGTIAIVFAASVISGVGMFSVLASGPTPEGVMQLGATLAVALLLTLALMVPLLMALWFAPPLVVFHDMGAAAAMKASFVGCLKNLLSFLVYGLVVLVASVVASIPAMLGWLVLGPVLGASVYTAYRDIYFNE